MASMDELEPDELLQMCCEGVPFTGVAVEFHLNGARRSEIEYVQGVQSGGSRDYSLEGVLVYEARYLNGGLHGLVREWFPNGCVKSEAQYEFGIEVNYREWNTSGELVESRAISPESQLFPILKDRRRAHEQA
ncbi:toxin-antitoxin system YwqK family antitoxin [Corallococcus aberystwythensis]|uniref:toxin-antitoxin system YwqK family antitoxin n=1 Tax=Corallococcus aberystwythensis TaxID=2316722 RepID=UPI0011C43009|nr:hypothetical protein [Corallococcus aberystwythensis]